MPQASAGGFVLILALLNAWLAARCGRSSLGWFLASLLLAPLAWLLTLFLVTRPRVAPDTSSAPRAVVSIAALLLAVLVGGWTVLLVAAPQAGATLTTGGLGHEVVPPEAMTLSISNGTTLTVTLVVDGIVVRTVAPSTGADPIPASALPALPWVVEARSPSGRVLTSMTVKAGAVWQVAAPVEGGSESKGVGARADLSCGRLDIWSGPPMIGPAPGPGSPGDCAP